MKLFGWICLNIILPLAPALSGLTIRWILFGETKIELTEFSFSLAILLALLLKSIGKLSDKDLQSGLSTTVIVLLLMTTIVFFSSHYVKGSFDKNQSGKMKEIELACLSNQKSVDTASLSVIRAVISNKVDKDLEEEEDRLRHFTWIMLALVIPATIFLKHRFKLDE